jgi:integrase
MAIARLTENFVEKTLADPVSKDTSFFDTEQTRFALRVWPCNGGSKAAYFIRYVDQHGRERKFKIGSPSSMALKDARKAAKMKLGAIDNGGDPVREKSSARAAFTVRDVVALYRKNRAWTKKTEATRRSDTIRLDRHIIHHLGSRTLVELKPVDVRAFVDLVRTDKRMGKRGRRLGGDGAARKCLRLLSAVVSWAIEQGFVDRHPFAGTIKMEGDGTRETVITDPNHYQRLIATLNDMVEDGSISPAARAFFITILLTGMRRGEAQKLRWNQIDVDTMTITLSTSKGGKLARSGIKSETLAVPAFVTAVIKNLAAGNDADPDDLVFRPSRGEGLEVTRLWRRISERAQLPAGLTTHGLRHSIATRAALIGMSAPEIQILLRHRQPSTTTRYIKAAEMALSRPADRVALDVLGVLHRAATAKSNRSA